MCVQKRKRRVTFHAYEPSVLCDPCGKGGETEGKSVVGVSRWADRY